jgi:CHORD
MAAPQQVQCTRPGCGLQFDDTPEGRAQENVCSFHHGAPIFHEGRKGWDCCKKRVDSFEEFTQIPGLLLESFVWFCCLPTLLSLSPFSHPIRRMHVRPAHGRAAGRRENHCLIEERA